MAALKLHRQRWQAKVRVPKERQADYGGKQYLYKHFATSDRRVAQTEANAWAALLKLEWSTKRNPEAPPPASLRALYDALRRQAESGEFLVQLDGARPVEAGIEYEIDKMADTIGERDLTDPESAQLAALQDALSAVRGERVKPRKELEPAFSELTDDYLKLWKTQRGLKDTNTEQQKRATYKLFEGFWSNKPIRGVRSADAAAFHDQLRQLDPNWKRSPTAAEMTWSELQRSFGGKGGALADATMNRHMATLKALWDWARRRGHCSGDNPFDGFHRSLKHGINVDGYVAWETDELKKLFDPPPRRSDLTELILVGMFTAMRLDEIASLTWGQIKTADGVTYFDVIDAKTPAGNRRVPLHDALTWLKDRREGKPAAARVWPNFNPEGPGKKAGADAGKEFSRFKTGRGFIERKKAFHSFRKNVTRIMERARVPENEWAQVLGHEKGFTYGVYNPDGITMERRKEIVGLIRYPGVDLPNVATTPRGAECASDLHGS